METNSFALSYLGLFWQNITCKLPGNLAQQGVKIEHEGVSSVNCLTA